MSVSQAFWVLFRLSSRGVATIAIAVWIAAVPDMTSASESDQESATPMGAPVAPPALNGAQIRALRPTGLSPVTQFQLRIEHWADNSSRPSIQTRIVTLGEDYVAVDEQNALRIYDFALDRVFVIPRDEDHLLSWSIYGLTAARVLEVRNRVYLRGLLDSTGGSTTSASLDQFAFESELGVTAENLPRIALRQAHEHGSTTFSNGGEVVAEFKFSSLDLSTKAHATLLRYLRHTLPLHPVMFSSIVEQLRAPERFLLPPASPQYSQSVVTFSNWKIVERDYPLAIGLSSAEPADYEYENIRSYIAIVMPVVRGKHGTMPPLEEVLNEAREANDVGDPIGSYITVLNGLQYSSKFGRCVALEATTCESALFFIQQLLQDPEVARIHEALGADQTDGSAVANAVETFASVNFDRHHNGVLMSVWLANSLTAARRHNTLDPAALNGKSDDAEKLLLQGIGHNPLVPNYHKDLGDLLLENNQAIHAWLIYDLARSIPGRRGGDLLDQVNRFEETIRDKYPWFFLP